MTREHTMVNETFPFVIARSGSDAAIQGKNTGLPHRAGARFAMTESEGQFHSNGNKNY